MDFNTDSIVTAKAKNLIPLTIIERVENLVDAWEFYYKKDKQDAKAEYNIKARLHSLHIKIKWQMKETFKTEAEYIEYCNLIQSDEVGDWDKATNVLFKYLYTIGLTKLSVQKVYDYTNLEAENEAFNL